MRFLIIVTFRNASDYIEQCLYIIQRQQWRNFKCIVIDDASDDYGSYTMPRDDRFVLIKNKTRQYALKNIVEAVWRYGKPDDIVATVDGDDYLSDSDALQAVRAFYDMTGADAIWTQHRTPDGAEGISRAMTDTPLKSAWTMSHLRTFKKRLIDGIRPALWRDTDGEWWRCAYDNILYRAVLQKASKSEFLPRVCYVYRGPQGEHKQEIQRQTAKAQGIVLRKEFANYDRKKNVCFIIAGENKHSDKRFFQGEKRPPMGVLSMAAILQARGHTVTLIDRYAKPHLWERDKIAAADFIGVSTTTVNLSDAMEILQAVQQYRPGKKIAVGGAHAVLQPGVFAGIADYVGRGECDYEIIDMVEDGKASGRKQILTHLDSLPGIDYNILTADHYSDGWHFGAERGVITMNTSRSCPHDCAFCEVKHLWGKRWRARSAERVIDDVLSMGAPAVYFREDNFCADPARVRAISSGLAGSGIRWSCELRSDTGSDASLIEAMAAGGCCGLYIGAESGSQKMLDIYSKGITPAQTISTCRNAKAAGIRPIISIIENHPAEDEADKIATEKMIAACGPYRVYRCVFREL